MSRGYLFVVTPWEKDVLYHKRMVNFTGGYQAPFSCDRKVSIEQAVAFVQPWKCCRTVLQQVEIQAPLKLIPKLLLTSPEARFPQKNPYEYFKSLELYFNSNVFPMELEIKRKKREVKACWRKRNRSFLPPSLHRKILLITLRSPHFSALLFPLLLQVSSLQSSGAHGIPERGTAPLLALLALWDQPTA